ncbi:GTSE1 protein, partial [Polioptila caerulea]|nr:GTSE1 protein [Polioptila caerulea]
MEEEKETSAQSLGHLTEEKVDICLSNAAFHVAVSDFPLLSDEKFDFDLSLSSTSGNEDEVFVGPVGHKERCIAANIESRKCVSAFDEKLTWSPLQGEKFVEIFKEAHLLALQIETGSKNKETKINQSEEEENKIVETFVEDSKSKLKILRNKNIEISPRAVKRETYCVQDSPACQLPPCFQKALHKLVSDDKVHALPAPPKISPVKNCLSPTKNSSLTLTEEQKTKETNTKAIGKLPMAKLSSTFGKSNLLTTDKVKLYYGIVINYFVYYDNVEHLQVNFLLYSVFVNTIILGFSSNWFLHCCVTGHFFLFLIQPGLRKMTYLKCPRVASGLTRKTTSSSSSSSVSSMNSSLNSSLPISPIGKKG